MSKAEAFEVNFGDNKSIGVNVNFSKGDAIQVPVNINSLDAEKVGKEVGDRIAEKLDETGLASVAKESTLLMESQRIQDEVRNIDLSSVESKVEEESQAIQGKIDAIPATDLTPVAKEATLNAKTDTIAEKIGEVLDKISTTFTLSIVGQKGRHNIFLAGTIEDVPQGSPAYMEGNTLHLPNATMKGNTLVLNNARVEGNVLIL